jgi:hypothetical protein
MSGAGTEFRIQRAAARPVDTFAESFETESDRVGPGSTSEDELMSSSGSDNESSSSASDDSSLASDDEAIEMEVDDEEDGTRREQMSDEGRQGSQVE